MLRNALRTAGVAAAVAVLAGVAQAGPLIERVYTENARYTPGEPVAVRVQLRNTTGQSWSGPLGLSIRLGGVPVHEQQRLVSLPSGGPSTQEVFNWTAPPLDFRGYAVEVVAGDVDRAASAVDVSSDWTRFPRYGYLTQFYSGQSSATSAELIRQLVEDYHIDGLQFYDWMWRHEQVIQRPRPGVINDPWIDWRGSAISFAVLTDLITEAHDRSVAAMPYFLIYGGRENYATVSGVSPEWGIYADPNHATQHGHELNPSAGINLFLFDPANAAWQDHLMGEVADAVEALDFDGVHYDQLGYKHPIYNHAGAQLDFSSGWFFLQALNRTRTTLDALTGQTPPALGERAMTFNLVGAQVNGWGAPDVVTQSDCDFLYAEIWGNESYAGVVDYVRWARGASGGKAVVLPSYLNYYDEMPQFNEPSARLATAAFAVAGAHRLELGDGDRMLSHEFFPWVRKQMTPSLRAAMKRYYSFLTAYENVLFDPQLTWSDQGAQWVSIAGQATSSTPSGNAIWVQRRARDGYQVIHLVNLLGNDDQWRNPATPPTPLGNLALTCRIAPGAVVQQVVAISPDGDGLQQELAFNQGSDSAGAFVAFTLPGLEYWSTVLMRSAPAAPGERYEAEDGLKTNVAVDTDHAGYSGSGFVDEFTSGPGEGVAFSVCVPADGVYPLRLAYANGTRTTAQRSVYVDGVAAGTVALPPLANWDIWGVAEHPVELPAGAREIVVGFGGTGAINLDYLELPPPAGGLRGQYFRSHAFDGPAAVRVDGPVEFNWAAGAPVAGLAADDFTVRWSGWVAPPVTGRYTFTVSADGDARLFVDGALVVDDWDGMTGPPAAGELMLAADESYRIVLVYRAYAGNAAISLKWSAPGLPEQVIPAERLAPDGCALDDHAPTTPASLLATSGATHLVQLTWAPAIDDVALAGYEVLRDGAPLARVSTTSFTDGAALAGATYAYAVRGRDLFGNVSTASPPQAVTAGGTPVLGDINGDGLAGPADFLEFPSCLAGPDAAPAPAAPRSASECRTAFDADGDGDVDLRDFAALAVVFASPQ